MELSKWGHTFINLPGQPDPIGYFAAVLGHEHDICKNNASVYLEIHW